MLLKVYLRLGSMGLAYLPLIYHKQSPKYNVNIPFVPWIRPGTTKKNRHRNWNLLWSQHSSFSQFTRIASIGANSKVDEGDKITYVQPEQDPMWMFPKMVVPHNGWFIMENPKKMDDLGVPQFRKHPWSDSTKRS